MQLYNILIIDDQEFKLKEIDNVINKECSICDYAMDLLTAKKKIKQNKYEFVLLDMTISDGISNNEFVGIDILNYLDTFEIATPVIVITQFYDFNDLTKSADKNGFYLDNKKYNKELTYNFSTQIDIHELPHLHLYLSENYRNYLGCVLYIQNNSLWSKSLKTLLAKLGGEGYENIIIG